MFFKDPDKVFEELKTATDGIMLFQKLKLDMNIAYQKNFHEFIKAVKLHQYHYPAFDACIMQMHEPKEITKPYFIDLVKRVGNIKDNEKYRYLLLEASIDNHGINIAYLCKQTINRHIMLNFKTTIFLLTEF